MNKPLTVADPRSPATVAAYVGYFIFGLIVGPGPFVSLSVSTVLPSWSENVWAYSLLAGGALFLLGAIVKRHIYWALTLQGAGSLAAFSGLLTYGVCIYIRSGFPNGVPFLVFVEALAIASLIRGVTCLRDSSKLTKLVAPVESVPVVADPDHSGKPQ